MENLMSRRGGHYACLIGVCLFTFFWNLGAASLWDLDEGRNASCADAMLTADNWIVPTFNGKLRVDKPVLLYWLQMLGYSQWGVSEYSARFPSALAGLLTVLVTYELARRMFDARTGFLAGLIAATSPMLIGASRFANPDALLNLFTLLTFALFWIVQSKPTVFGFVLVGTAAGLGVLAKGPVAIVLPGAVIVAYLVLRRDLLLLLDRRVGWAMLACVLVAAPWYIWVAVETHGEFPKRFFFTHNVSRFMNTMERHDGGPLYYPAVLLGGLAPWTVVAAPALWFGVLSMVRNPRRWLRTNWEFASEPHTLRNESDRSVEDCVGAYQLLGLWIGVYVVFFSLAATKLPNYALPVVVPCAVLGARYLERWRIDAITVSAWVMPTSLLCLGLVGVGWIMAILIVAGEIPVAGVRTFPALAPWAWAGILPLGGMGASLWFHQIGNRAEVVRVLALTAVLFSGTLATGMAGAFNRYKAPAPLVESASLRQPHREILVGGWRVEHLPSLNFYLHRDVTHHASLEDAAQSLRWPMPVYLILPASDWETLASGGTRGREVARQFDMFQYREFVVVSNE